MWGENTDAAEVMALPWNVAPGVGGANGWNRGPVPAQVGGPGAPMGRGVPGRGLEGGPPLWHPAQQAPLPPQWAHQPVHQSWQQPGSMNNMPQQPWQQTMEPKKLLSRGMPLVQPPQQQQPPQWGAHKVEQSTPWETPGQAKDWQTPAGAAPWAAPPQQQPQQQQQQQQPQQPQQQAQPWQAPEWQNTPQHRPDPAVGQWQQQAPQPAPIMGMPPQPQQWGQPPPMGHVPHVPEPQRGMDMNPGQPGPWVAPQPSEVNNDMMWHDPNPKAKRMQRDTGTAVWGDPALQMTDIKRWKDVEDEMKPSGSDWNSPQPTGWGDPLPSDRWGQPGWEEPSHDSEGAQLGGVSGAPNAYRQMPDINSLTHQISEKLRNAVNKGFVRVELLSQQLSPEKISMLNQLLQKVPRLEQATQEIEHLRRNVHNTSSKTEYDRLVLEVEQLKLEMAMLQSKISESPQMGGPNPGTAGSRLNQWKKSNVEERSNLDNLVGALTLDDKLHGPTEWSTGGNDWGAENVLDVGKDDKDGPPGAPGDVDGPREFVPGKKWEWRDPNKVAEDPNATPGSQGQMFGGALPGNNAFGGWSSLIENTWSNASPR